MTYYSLTQLARRLAIDESFLVRLERESIVVRDAPPGAAGDFSDLMLERARVSWNLVHDLDVNLAGAAIIVRMREDLSELQRRLARLLREQSGPVERGR